MGEAFVCLVALGVLTLLIAGVVWLVNVGGDRLTEWLRAVTGELRDPQPVLIFNAAWF